MHACKAACILHKLHLKICNRLDQWYRPQPIAAAPVKQSEAASQNGSSKPEEKEVKHDPYKPDPKATYTEHGTYRVPEDQVSKCTHVAHDQLHKLPIHHVSSILYKLLYYH